MGYIDRSLSEEEIFDSSIIEKVCLGGDHYEQ